MVCKGFLVQMVQPSGRLVKIDFDTGEILAESTTTFDYGQFAGVDLNGTIYMTNGNGNLTLYCLSPDLELLYQIYLGNGCAYSNAIPGPDGIMVVTTRTKAFALQTDQSEILFPPNDFVANIDIATNEILIEWNEPHSSSFTIQGYNIYKNDVKINANLITDLEYTYIESETGDYHYYATTVYTSGESDASFYDFLAVKDLVAGVEGTVVELSTGNPIENAEITIGPQSVLSGPDGSFGIYQIIPGTYDIIIEAVGYNVYNESTVILPGDTLILNAELTAPELSYNLDEIYAQLIAGQQEEVTLSITNNGNGPADWNVRLFYEGIYKNSGIVNSKGAGTVNDLPAEYKGEKLPASVKLNDMQFTYDMEALTGKTNIIAAETDGFDYYVVTFSSDEIFKVSFEGELLETFYIDDVSDLRDLAWDGTYFYGSDASSNIFIMDFFSKELIGSFSVNATVRSIAYDVEYDGFWVGDWNTPIKLFDRQGNLLNTITGVPTVFGTAYDNVSEGGPYLWLSVSPESGICYLEQWEIATGSSTGVIIPISEVLGYCSHGGLFLAINIYPNTITLGGIVQGSPDILFGISAGDMDNWISPEVFSGTVHASDTYDLNITLDASNLNADGSYNGSLVIVPNPEVGMHTVNIYLDVLTGIDQFAEEKFVVYPNPANGVLNFDLDETSDISIYSSAGLCVFEKAGLQNKYQLDVQDFTPGIYFVNIRSLTNTHNIKVIVR